MSEVLIKVDQVSKKFSRNLRTSLRYGFSDAVRVIFGIRRNESLRPTEFWAVKKVSFVVKRGESIGLIGHNGAGKSTLLKVLNGLLKPDAGRIEIRGKIGALIELGAGFNPILTGRENIFINAAVLGFSKKEVEERLDSIIEFAELAEFIDTPVQNYSSGMKVRLGFAVAAQMEPDVLIIDEVLAVGDNGFKVKCFNRIEELKQKCAVIFVSHSMPQISRICTKAVFLNKGEVKYQGENITEAIEQYYNSFSRSAFKSRNEFGNIEINKIEVTNQRKEAEVNHNDDLHINLNYAYQTNKRAEAINIIFFDQDYKSVASSIAKLDESKQKTANRIEFIIPGIQLGIGTYYLSIQFFENLNSDSRGVALEFCQNVTSFSIKKSPMVTAASFQLINKINIL